MREKEARVENDKFQGLKAEARNVTINEMFDLWCQVKRGLKNNTFENDKYMYNLFAQPNFGKHRIFTLKKSDVKQFYNQLLDKRNVQASTVDTVHTVLLPHFSCHSLGHTFTTRMCEAGVNVKVIRDTLGHGDISTTCVTYERKTFSLRRVR